MKVTSGVRKPDREGLSTTVCRFFCSVKGRIGMETETTPSVSLVLYRDSLRKGPSAKEPVSLPLPVHRAGSGILAPHPLPLKLQQRQDTVYPDGQSDVLFL